jgi:hypothetical protein
VQTSVGIPPIQFHDYVNLENMLKNAPTLAIGGVHTAENEPPKVLKFWKGKSYFNHGRTLLGRANASTLALPRTTRPRATRISPLSCTPSLLRGSEPQTRTCGNRPEQSGTFDFDEVRVL